MRKKILNNVSDVSISNNNFYNSDSNTININSYSDSNLNNDYKKVILIIFGILIILAIIGLIITIVFNKKISNEEAENLLEDISITFETQSDNMILEFITEENQISFKNNNCSSIDSNLVKCSNGEILKFYPEDYDYKIKNIFVRYNKDEEIAYIEAMINGYKHYLNLEEKRENKKIKEEEELEQFHQENKIKISCESYEEHNKYDLNTEFTLIYNNNVFVSYEQKNVEDYTNFSASAWNNAKNSYSKSSTNNPDIIINEKNKTITTYIGTNHKGSNGNEDIFKELTVTEALNKMETTFGAICEKSIEE